MKQAQTIFIFSFILFVSFIFCGCGSKPDKKIVPVKQGVCSMEQAAGNFSAELKGDFIFIPFEYVDPASDFSRFTRFENINKSWITYSEPLKKFGYATYAVRLKNLSEDTVYAVKLTEISSAVTAYLDGVPFFRSGINGKTEEEEVFNWSSEVVILPLNGKTEADLVFHVSNFNDKFPGFHKPIRIGSYSTLKIQYYREIIFATLIAGVLFLLFVFFTSLYIFYPKEKRTLYFGLLCASFSVRSFCYDLFLLDFILPIKSAVTHKVGYITFCLCIIFFVLFINKLFGRLRAGGLCIILFPAAAYLTLNIFVPISVSTSLLVYAQIYLLIIGIFYLYIIFKETLQKNKSALVFLCSLFLFMIFAVWDILVSNAVIEGPFTAQFGLLVMVIPMSIMVLNRFKVISANIAGATKKIEVINTALERFVPHEFMKFLDKKHTQIRLGDNGLQEMYIVFLYIGIYTSLKTEQERLNVLEIYNHILAKVNPLIKQCGGFIDKYLTERLMILFPSNNGGVIKCILNIEKLIKAENGQRQKKGLPAICFSCGVHYGQVMIGTIGESERMDNTVISDVVNAASRLQVFSMDNGCSILVSGEVKYNEEKLHVDGVAFRSIGPVKFRGKNEAIHVYEAVSNE